MRRGGTLTQATARDTTENAHAVPRGQGRGAKEARQMDSGNERAHFNHINNHFVCKLFKPLTKTYQVGFICFFP